MFMNRSVPPVASLEQSSNISVLTRQTAGPRRFGMRPTDTNSTGSNILSKGQLRVPYEALGLTPSGAPLKPRLFRFYLHVLNRCSRGGTYYERPRNAARVLSV